MNSDSLGQNLPFFVRKLSVIDMEFSDFFDMLWTYLGSPDESKDNKGRPKFFCHLIDLIIRTPQTDVEDEKAQSGDLNPFAGRVADTINKYCIGSRPIPKKDAKELLSRISNGKKFVDEINFSPQEQEKNTIEKNVDDLSHHISQLVNEAQKIKNQQGLNVQTALLNEYADKKAELKQLEDENKNYQKKKKLRQDKKDQQDALKATINTELAEVQHSLNTEMASLNEQACGSSSFQPPRIELKPTGYNFETINDQGTGTSFKGLIIFDQACLDLTRLPFFIHDSLLFSNIEIDRRNRIIKMYAQETKQIFI